MLVLGVKIRVRVRVRVKMRNVQGTHRLSTKRLYEMSGSQLSWYTEEHFW